MKPDHRRLRRAWLFDRQKGACCLQIGKQCRARGGAMQMENQVRRDYATFEHLVPRCQLKGSRAMHDTVLLACRRCNHIKRNRMADPSLIAWARALWLEFQHFQSAQALEKSRAA